MNGDLFFNTFCGVVAFIGVIAVLFSLVLTAAVSRERGAIGLFVLAVLFCCFLVFVISLLPFI